jgi:hypothetical protein
VPDSGKPFPRPVQAAAGAIRAGVESPGCEAPPVGCGHHPASFGPCAGCATDFSLFRKAKPACGPPDRFPETRCLAGKPSPRDQDAPMTRMDETVLQTPYYLDRQVEAAQINMEKIARSCASSPARKALLALKCFATWGVFDFMRRVHGRHHLVVAQRGSPRPRPVSARRPMPIRSPMPITRSDEVVSHADKIIFNSISQLTRFSEPVVRHHSRPAAQSRRLVLVLRSRRSGAAVLAAGRMGSEKGRAGDGDDLPAS